MKIILFTWSCLLSAVALADSLPVITVQPTTRPYCRGRLPPWQCRQPAQRTINGDSTASTSPGRPMRRSPSPASRPQTVDTMWHWPEMPPVGSPAKWPIFRLIILTVAFRLTVEAWCRFQTRPTAIFKGTSKVVRMGRKSMVQRMLWPDRNLIRCNHAANWHE